MIDKGVQWLYWSTDKLSMNFIIPKGTYFKTFGIRYSIQLVLIEGIANTLLLFLCLI